MIELLILVVGIPLSAWLLMHFLRLTLKSVEYFEGRK